MRLMRAIAIVFVIVVALTSVCLADTVEYTILGNNGFDDCSFGNQPDTYSLVVATLHLSQPAKALQISAPDYCPGFNVSWSLPVSGDPNTLLTVDLGGCVSGSIQLFTASGTVADCCPALLNGPKVIGPSQDSPPVLIGCDDAPRYLIPPCSASEPQLLTPTDGEPVSTSPFMSWGYNLYGDFCLEGIGVPVFTVFYGTDPGNLDQSASWLESNQGTLTGLSPQTQYFWQVRIVDEFAWYTGSMVNYSAIQSFTTDAPVPVEQATWGAVKALYRE